MINVFDNNNPWQHRSLGVADEQTDTDPATQRAESILAKARAALERADEQRHEHELWLADVEARKAAQEYIDETNRRKQEEQKRVDAVNERKAEGDRIAQRRARAELERMEAQSAKRLPAPLQHSDSGRHPKIFYRDVI